MDNAVVNHVMMEELRHPSKSLPISEFVDNFDAFAGGGFPSHWHHELELQIILNGSAEYNINGSSYVVEEGQAIYIAPEAVHMAKQLSAGTIGYDVVLSPQVLIDLMRSIDCEKYVLPLITHWPDALVITPERKAGHAILGYLKKMYYVETAHTNQELFFLENLMGIWRNLLTLFPKYTVSSEDSGKLLREERIKVMLHYVQQNYSQAITIQDIASAANISKSECFRCFSSLSKMTPVEYLTQFRLLQATQLLVTTKKSISDICYTTGFNSTSYFSQKFKNQYGISPKVYRATNRV